jgi:hypothetical protein
MGIFTKLGLGGIADRAPSRAKFLKRLTVTDLLDTDPVIPSSQWTRVGKYTVPAQNLLHWGYGAEELPDNQGYMYIFIQTDAVGDFVNGKVRLVQANANETTKFVLAEFELDAMHGSKTNRAMMQPLPEMSDFPLVGEDSLLFLEVFTTTGDTLDTSECDISIPVTVYQV